MLNKKQSFFTLILVIMVTGTGFCMETDNHQNSPHMPESSDKSIMNPEINFTEDVLAFYFNGLIKKKIITQRDIAEALFVSQSTICSFLNKTENSEYVCKQFDSYRKNSKLDFEKWREKIDKVPVQTFDQIEHCLEKSLQLPIMPASLRQAETLRVYFKGLLGLDCKEKLDYKDKKAIELCDECLKLKGILEPFIDGRDSNSNITKTVYEHLLGYYRGIRLVQKEEFRSLRSIFYVQHLKKK